MKVQGICDSCGKAEDMPNGASRPVNWFAINVSSSASFINMTYCQACYETIVWPVDLVPSPDPAEVPKLPVSKS